MTPERLAFLRGPMGGGRMLTAEECRELCDAYEEASKAVTELRGLLVTTVGGLGKAISAIDRWKQR